jgi:outer membrane receptor protein involved in Fe transport
MRNEARGIFAYTGRLRSGARDKPAIASRLPAVMGCSGRNARNQVATEAATLAGWIRSSDTASLLSGVDAAQAGGLSGLPMIHGLGDDRIRTLVNGVPVTAACPMHMNPPLSYIDPAAISRVETLPGVTPVRLGGDSIAGTIEVESAPPSFAVARKSAVDPTRLEPPTPGYSLLDLCTAYVWRNFRLAIAVSDLLDRRYANPLGGTWQSARYAPGYGRGRIPASGGSGQIARYRL